MAYLDTLTKKVNILPTGIPTPVHLSQSENGRTLSFEIIGGSGEIPAGSVVTLTGTKPDGVVYSAVGTLSGNIATFEEDVQLTAAAGVWPAKIEVTNGGHMIATGRISFTIDADPVAPGSVPSESELDGLVAQAAMYAETARSAAYGSPLAAATAADMIDTTRVYVYTGNEAGMENGHWYYWEDGAWKDGGIYNAAAVQTDTSLSIPGMAADAAATGEALAEKADTSAMTAETEARETAITDLKADLEQNYAQKDGVYPDLAAGIIATDKHTSDATPYLFRHTGGSKDVGNREHVDAIVGGTVAENQLCNGESVTVASGHKYAMRKSGAWSVGASTGAAITGLVSGTDMVIDLTQMFGATIADYLYSIKTATAGAGIAKLREWGYFTQDYYEYNPGSLESVEGVSAHETVGFNQFDSSLFAKQYPDFCTIENGVLRITSDGVLFNTGVSVDIPGDMGNGLFVSAKIKTESATNVRFRLVYEDGTMADVAGVTSTDKYSEYIQNVTHIKKRLVNIRLNWSTGGSFQIKDFCINLSDPARNGEYEPYKKNSYPLDSTLTLRGIPKLSEAGDLYYDGDRYLPDGTVERRYGVRAYQSGDESLADAITDGTNTVYKLTTPTTETAHPYRSYQECDPDGTEEYVTTGIVPVGHETRYPLDLARKIEDLYGIPTAPTTAGTYTLKAVVTSSGVEYQWVAE